MKTCYRCHEPIHNADMIESPRGVRHPYACSTAPPVVEALPAAPAAPEPKVVVQYVKSDPEVVETFNRAKAAVLAAVAAILGSAGGVLLRTFI